MISSLAWIKKGIAKENPQNYEISEEEFDKIKSLTGKNLKDAKKAYQKTFNTAKNNSNDDELAEYNMEDYDNEYCTEEEEGDIDLFFSNKLVLDQPEEKTNVIPNEDDEDINDIKINSMDSLLLVGKTEDDLSILEVYVYENEANGSGNLYVHHDIMLPSFPLCVEPINYNFQQDFKNFCAVGTFLPEIEIWNLDFIDPMYPHIILDKEHKDAVLGLSWNSLTVNILASCSADCSVKLWDLQTQKCVKTFDHHSDKVSVVKFSSSESSVILSGSFDKSIVAMDVRMPGIYSKWKLKSDVECISWDPHNETCFAVSTEDGIVNYFDCRMNVPSKEKKNKGNPKALFTISAHEEAVSSLDISPFIPGMLITGSSDKTLKVWDIGSGVPTLVSKKEFEDSGRVFGSQFCVDSPYCVAIGGSKGNLIIWNFTDTLEIRQTFQGRTGKSGIVNMSGSGSINLEELDVESHEQENNDSDDMEEIISELRGQ